MSPLDGGSEVSAASVSDCCTVAMNLVAVRADAKVQLITLDKKSVN